MARPADKREQILEAAKTMFARHGFQATTTDAVAREAGLAVGTIYNYFGNKEDLLTAIFREASERRARFWEAAEKAVVSPLERIALFADRHFADIGEDPRVGVILVQCLDGKLQGLHEFREDLRRRLEANLQEAAARHEIVGDLELLAVSLLGMLEGLVRYGCEPGRDPEGFWPRAAGQVRRWLGGLRPSGGG
jgi:TetR/AcrR family fatty acid metabolism transcriptional regulator